MIQDLRTTIGREEFDYLALLQALDGLQWPRNKITALLKQGAIIRVKKGIYVFGKKLARRPYSREVLANMIYGPSYISLEYALQYQGLIPERVEAITSVTTGRGRRFSTPVGLFIYKRISAKAYSLGFDQESMDEERSFLIATPEKALADKIQDDRGVSIRTHQDMRNYLTENLRIDPGRIAEMDAKFFTELAGRYRSRKIRLLARLVSKLQKAS
jgi:predicted transcriptional regulator of viral defense system